MNPDAWKAWARRAPLDALRAFLHDGLDVDSQDDLELHLRTTDGRSIRIIIDAQEDQDNA